MKFHSSKLRDILSSQPCGVSTMPTTEGIGDTTFKKYVQVLNLVVRNLVNIESSTRISSSTTTTTTTRSTTTTATRKLSVKRNSLRSSSSFNGLLERDPISLAHVDPGIFHLLGSLPKVSPEVIFPVIPPKHVDQRYTLVLDMDETLLHTADNTKSRYSFKVEMESASKESKRSLYVSTRPYLEHFLEEINQYFEIIVFTAGNRSYADAILNKIDPKGDLIQHRLYRDSCTVKERKFIKNLNLLGRDLDYTVLVDNSLEAFGFHLENGLLIQSWTDDQQDECLLKLLKNLKEMVAKQYSVPEYLNRRFGLADDVRAKVAEVKNLPKPKSTSETEVL